MGDTVVPETAGGLPEPSGDAFAVVDGHGALAGWSVGAQRLLGYPADEVRGRGAAWLLYRPSDAAGLVRRGRSARSNLLGPVTLRHRDGGEVEAVLWVHLMTSPAGEPQWLLQAAEAAAVRRADLRRSLLRGLFTESPFIIDVFDSELRLLAQNDSQRRAQGFAEETVGRTMREAAPPGLLDLDALEERQRRVLATGVAQIGAEVHGRDPADPQLETVWSESILPLRSSAGEIVALAHLVADVTEEARARGRLALVNDASVCIGSTLDVLRTAQELADFAVPRFADYAYVNLLDAVFSGGEPVTGPPPAATPLRRAAESMVDSGPETRLVALGEIDLLASRPGSPTLRALVDGKPRLLSGETLATRYPPSDERGAALRSHGVHSLILVPMHARGAALGTAMFFRFRRTRNFEPDDVLLAQEVVARAAVCIDNASRYTRERTTALALQRSLQLQRLPALRTLDAASRYLPPGGPAVLGGAWFDLIPLSCARVALVVGDTAGEGVHAAVAMGRLRTAVRTFSDLDMAPDELLTHLSDLVKRAGDGHGLGPAAGSGETTCMYAVFDPISQQCALASAGHPWPALVTAGGVEYPRLAAGAPLGVDGAPYESCEMTLSQGDLLVLHSAGLLATGDGRPDGDGADRLRGALRDARVPASTARETGRTDQLDRVCDALLRRLLPQHRVGDVALLVTRSRGPQADRHATWDVPAEPEAVGRARTLTGGKLSEWGLEELEYTAQLLVSELVTNAVRYGSPPIRLRLILDRRLICEVTDGSSTSPHVRRALKTDEGGRGLFLVTQLAELWGTRYHARGKSIWAELPLPAES
ncbi:ATP-binding SpoIIE family protein phosphatase [Streptacidiphilus griseoplanus]|uniref:ATP-binding SpoIIE family protein phosphatase n=1 Tax=Peterkaempfera griseoplana TaxID=66896 RepID=UPI0007C8319B|nr:SpoIIE family protein phosphatase [Peterkaempfera griseoplana]